MPRKPPAFSELLSKLDSFLRNFGRDNGAGQNGKAPSAGPAEPVTDRGYSSRMSRHLCMAWEQLDPSF